MKRWVKRIWLALCAGLLVALAWQSVSAQSSRYEPQADARLTAAAPWKVAQVVARGKVLRVQGVSNVFVPVYRQFMGVTAQGGYIVQDFYEQENSKLSSPYVLLSQDSVSKPDFDYVYPGEIHGLYVRWDENGKRELDVNYSYGSYHGDQIKWYPNGQKRSQSVYDMGIQKRPFLEWHRNGRKACEREYWDNREHGWVTCWHENGRLKEEGQMLFGKRQGVWMQWSDSGGQSSQEEYLDGRKHGMWTQWGYGGEKESQGSYVEDEKHGRWVVWNSRGEVVEDGAYWHGQKMGVWKTWRNGELKEVDYGTPAGYAPPKGTPL